MGTDPADIWKMCPQCGGICKVWAPGAPGYDCSMTLADRAVGEVVTLGNGERARILWHIPRKGPEFTFLGIVDEFLEVESHHPIPYPSCVGVSQVDNPRATVKNVHDRGRSVDHIDPIQRKA